MMRARRGRAVWAAPKDRGSERGLRVGSVLHGRRYFAKIDAGGERERHQNQRDMPDPEGAPRAAHDNVL